MNTLSLPRTRILNAGLFLGAVLAALTALSPSAHAGTAIDRPASYDVRDVRSSGPVGAVAVVRTASSNTVIARDARCDVRDVCSETPPIAAKPAAAQADAGTRNPACDVRDVCTSTGTPLARADAAVHYTRDATGGIVTR